MSKEEKDKKSKKGFFSFLKKKSKSGGLENEVKEKKEKKSKKHGSKHQSMIVNQSVPQTTQNETQHTPTRSQTMTMTRLMNTASNWQESTRKVMREGKFETFPIAGDLPRLLKHLSIVKENYDGEFETIFPYDEHTNKSNKAGDCFQVIKCIAGLFEGQEQQIKIEKEWKELIVDDEDMSVQKTFLMQIMNKVFIQEGEFKDQSPVITFLKAINQKIIANATMNLKIVCKDLLFKDSYPMFWEVACILQERAYLIHYRKQEATSKNPEEYFQFMWELRLVFTKDLMNLEEVSMGISSLMFKKESSQQIREKVQTTLKSILFDDFKIKELGENGEEEE